MIFTNKADFRYNTKWQDTAPRVTPFRHFVLALKLLSGEQLEVLRDAINDLLSTHKILIDSEHNNGYPGRLWNLGEMLKKWLITVDFIVYL